MQDIVKPGPEAHSGFLDAVIEGAIDCIIIISSRGIVQRFNQAATKLFGYEADEVIGENINMLMPEPQHSEHDGYLHNYLTTKIPAIIGIGREVVGVKKDGTRLPVRLAVSEVVIHGEHYFTGVLHDLSDIKAREKEVLELTQELEQKVRERTDELQDAINKLLQINKKLEHEVQERRAVELALRKSQEDLRLALDKEVELSELKSRFVSTASHEFRTPLSTILSSAGLVARYTKTEQQENREKHIQRIKSSVSMLTRILDDFLSLSRLEQGDVVMKPEELELYPLLQRVVDEMEGFLKTGQRIVITGATKGVVMYTDVVILRNILYNLLTNASKYSGSDDIGMHVRLLEGNVEIDISDQGIGIPESEQKHLFGRFFRAYNATNIQGTGLGLYIVSNYLKLLNGSIQMQSVEGEGTTFTITIPIDGASEK
jgi:PAS domain S-box-containing protein